MSRRVADSATGRVNWGNSSALNILGNLSVGLWVKFGSGAALNGVIMKRGRYNAAEADNHCFFTNLQGSSGAWDILYLHEYGAHLNEQHTFNTNLLNDKWYYLGFSRDTTGKTVTLYLFDGLTFSTVESWGYTNNPTGGTDTGCLLTEFQSDSIVFPDQIDDCSLAQLTYYSELLTANQHLHNALGMPKWGTSLLLFTPHWGPDSPDWDLSGNQRVGTLTSTITDVSHPPIVPMAPRQLRYSTAGSSASGSGPLVIPASGIIGRTSLVRGV